MNTTRESRGRSGTARRMAAVLAVACMTLAGFGGTATATTATTADAAGVRIPDGFLLYEGKVTRKKAEKKYGRLSWKVSDRRSVPLLIDPCDVRKRTDRGRVAARTVYGEVVGWDGVYSEQLIVYRDEPAARVAIDGLRSQLRKCAVRDVGDGAKFTHRTRRAHIGEEAFLVKGFYVASGMTGTVTRQGRAVAIYTFPGYPQGWRESDFGGPQARKMAGKLAAELFAR
ncbi:hypothetical protein [Streptosporangium sp. KLBMP 9127]|nr:hypothetical protein [Streptosporangium sp. KLBMP 9127]